MRQRITIALVFALAGAHAGAQQGQQGQQGPPKPDRFGPLRFMVGSWRGDQAGQPGKGIAERTYQFILDDRFLQEANTSTYPPQEQNKTGEVHHHLSLMGYDGTRNRFVFRQFHTEGFVNTYVQQPTNDQRQIIFVTEAIENLPAGYRARET